MQNFDYVDKINMNADKVAASTGNPYAGAVARYNQIAADLPGAVAAVFEKVATMQDVLVKFANVLDKIAENAVEGQADRAVAELISANQGNADTQVQTVGGVYESTQDSVEDSSAKSGDLDNGYMQDAKNEGDITSAQYNQKGVGLSPNKKETTGDIIAAAKLKNEKVQAVLRRLKNNK